MLTTEAKNLGLTGMARAKSDMQEHAITHVYLDQALSIIQASRSLLEWEVVLERGKIFDRQNQPQSAAVTLKTALRLAT